MWKKNWNRPRLLNLCIHTSWKQILASVDGKLVDFSTYSIFHILNLPHNGVELEALPELWKPEAEDIINDKIRWGKDIKWNYEANQQHWKEWFDFVNAYMLFCPKDHMMEQKYIVAAIRTWEGQDIK